MGWLIALGVVFLLAVLPLGVSVRYNDAGLLLRVILGPAKITVLPRPKKPEKETKQKEKTPDPKQEKKAREGAEEAALPKPPQPPTPEKKPAKEAENGGSLLDFLPLVKLALDFLGDFRRKLRLDNLQLKLILGGGDPSDLAINYGKTWAAVGNLMPHLERLFVIKKRDIEVECDFTASETLVIARLDLTITLGRLLSLAVVYGIRALIEFLSIRNKRKGGAVK